jgi:ATP-dependent exoDNAse (exonuclease V) alpha subunit
MSKKIKLLDVVALLENVPEVGLYQGQVGTVVEEYEPEVFEVEFSDTSGRAYALETLNANQLMVLHHCPILVS